jgi:hypothetical protein
VLRRGLAVLGRTFPQPDGYSPIEVGTVALGLLLVFAAAMQTLYGMVRPLCPPWGRIAALLAMWGGTSLLYYSAVFPFMAHAVGFALVVWIVAAARRLDDPSGDNRRLALLGGLLGVLFLVRPQQVTLAVFLLPYLVPPPSPADWRCCSAPWPNAPDGARLWRRSRPCASPGPTLF